MSVFKVRSAEANQWWQRNQPLGALLNKLMLLFIFIPIALVFKEFYTLSFVVFAFMIPYGVFIRYLAVRAVRTHLAVHPESHEQFEQEGIVAETSA
jgi:hypothetical protein